MMDFKERRTAKGGQVSDDPEQSAEFLLRRLANEQENNRKLRLLLRRAADALALELVSRRSQVQIQDYSYLIAELRKAAQ